MVYVTVILAPVMQIHPFCQTHLGPLLTDKAPTQVTPEYLDYAEVCLFDNQMELPKNTGMNKYAIKLIEGKQPLYSLIYSLELVELETLKTYIKTYQKTGFI